MLIKEGCVKWAAEDQFDDPLNRLRKNLQRIYSPVREQDTVEFPRRLPTGVISPQLDIR